jgi:poly(glycerol-phosphate) alpha-glucosyltransferase
MERDDRSVLLFLGRIHPKKGLETLIRAWRLIVHRSLSLGREWRLVVAGWDDGGHVPHLRKLLKDLDIERYVEIVGPVFGTHKHAALSHARAFILPSLSEGLPLTILEAWAYGLPVFMTRACNLPQGFDAGAAYELEPSPSQIADTLLATLPRGDLLARVGDAGRSLAASQFNWQNIANDWAQIYSWIVKGGDKPYHLVC